MCFFLNKKIINSIIIIFFLNLVICKFDALRVNINTCKLF